MEAACQQRITDNADGSWLIRIMPSLTGTGRGTREGQCAGNFHESENTERELSFWLRSAVSLPVRVTSHSPAAAAAFLCSFYSPLRVYVTCSREGKFPGGKER